ncbi:MAG: YggS family pyridoxal phosphate-dependent enzyme [Eubacteriales bacterium]
MKERLLEITKEIHGSCMQTNRSTDSVRLIAVSKTNPVSAIQEAYNLGCRDFGENKVQEFLEKYSQLPQDIRWHMIGHLQRNKVKYIIDKVAYIHSIDSYELALEVNRQAVKKGVPRVKVLIEVNIAREPSKYGVMIEDAPTLVQQIQGLECLSLEGFMTVAPYTENKEENKQYFTSLLQLLVDINGKNIDNRSISELSMGMSNDFPVAIQCGATMIRVGTRLFGERDYN